MNFKLLFAGLLIGISAIGQNFTNIKIDEGPALRGPEEPSISISVDDTNVMVAGVNIKTTYRSKDGGYTWQKQPMKSKYGVYGDPCIVSLPKNRFLYFHLSLPKGAPYVDDSFLDRIVCQYSKNSGKRFNRGKSIGHNPPKDQDKEWAVHDFERGRTYVTWTEFDTYGSKLATDSSRIMASYSDNLGKKWSAPVVISTTLGDCIDDDNTVEGAVPAVGDSGQMHVAWSNNQLIYYNKYMPNSPIAPNKVIAQQVGGWTQTIDGLNRTNGLPITVADHSNGNFKGSLYVCWSDQRNGELNTDVFITTSRDGGKTWSAAQKVNNDDTHTHQFLPWMTIDQTTGYLYVVYYDRSQYNDSRTDVKLAVSKNGGITFENYTISESPFMPHPNVFFGDYINISAHNGAVRPIWTRYEDGKLSVWTAIVNGI